MAVVVVVRRLSGRRPAFSRLLGTGLLLLVGAAAAQVVVSELIWARDVAVPRMLASLMSPLIMASYVAGAALVAGWWVLREVVRHGGCHPGAPSDAP